MRKPTPRHRSPAALSGAPAGPEYASDSGCSCGSDATTDGSPSRPALCFMFRRSHVADDDPPLFVEAITHR